MTARSERPISREISWVRPPMRAPDRLAVAAGVGGARQHRVLGGDPALPEPLRQRGTPSVNDAAQSTLVRPNSTRTLPSACSSQLRVMVTGRSWSAVRPSVRVMSREPMRRVRRVRRRPGRTLRRDHARCSARGHRDHEGGGGVRPRGRGPRRRAGRAAVRGVASSSARSAECHGGTCVTTSRPTPAARPRSPAWRPVRCRSGGVVVALDERRLAQQQVARRRPARRGRRTARCRRSRSASGRRPRAAARTPRPGASTRAVVQPERADLGDRLVHREGEHGVERLGRWCRRRARAARGCRSAR